MNSVRIKTKGSGVKVIFSKVTYHEELRREFATMTLLVADTEVDIVFDSPTEMIEFCNKHNFDYEDDRLTEKKEDAA